MFVAAMQRLQYLRTRLMYRLIWSKQVVALNALGPGMMQQRCLRAVGKKPTAPKVFRTPPAVLVCSIILRVTEAPYLLSCIAGNSINNLTCNQTLATSVILLFVSPVWHTSILPICFFETFGMQV